MSLLEQIQTGLSPGPRRTLIYGTKGIGKSSWANCSEKPIFMQTEDGVGDIDCAKLPMTRDFDAALTAISELYSEKHEYRTLVVDSLDWLERLIWNQVCLDKAVDSIDTWKFQEGYKFAQSHWNQFLEGLSALRNDESYRRQL